MTKRITRTQKVAAASNEGEKPSEMQAEATVTSMVERAGRPKLTASYAQIIAHRKPVVDKVKVAIAAISQSYDDHDADDRDARHERYELADSTLDWLLDRFDHNGFSNPGDRLVMAWLMLDLLAPIGHRTEEVCDQIEKVFRHHGQALSEHGLGQQIKRRRTKQEERRKAA